MQKLGTNFWKKSKNQVRILNRLQESTEKWEISGNERLLKFVSFTMGVSTVWESDLLVIFRAGWGIVERICPIPSVYLNGPPGPSN